MSEILYEHPLNEKVRSYLRLEHFLIQIDAAMCNVEKDHYYPFFTALFECFDVIERSDIKNELVKELEILHQNLKAWSEYPNVDRQALQQALSAISGISQQMPNAYRQLQHIKDDPFLQNLRQRFSISGGHCSFDLPNLHYWCQQHADVRQRTIEQWLLPVRQYQYALQSVMKFVRERDKFAAVTATQGKHTDTAEKLELLRIKIDAGHHYFPSISGNKFRFAIRFQSLCPDEGKKFIEHDVKFQLARC